MYKMKCCPPDCPGRSSTCHGTCKTYKRERAKFDADKAKLNKVRQEYYAPISVKVQQIQKMKKDMGYV